MITLIVFKVLTEPEVWGNALELAKTAYQTLNLLPKQNDQTVPADDEPYKPQPSVGEDDSAEEEAVSPPSTGKKWGRSKPIRKPQS